MATIRNAIDAILQAASPRILPVTLPTNVSLPWVQVASKPADTELLNSLAIQGTNLVPGLAKWTNSSPNYVWTNAPWSFDGTALIFPPSSPAGYTSYSPSFSVYPSNWHTISFTASGNGCELRVDLQPDTLPEQGFNLTATATRYSFSFLLPASWVGSPTTFIRFWRQSGTAQIAVYDIQIEVGTVATVYKQCKLDTVGINNQITSTNYTSYMAAQSVSAMAFSQNTGSATVSGTHVDTSLTFDSKGENILLHFVGQLSTAVLATNGSSYIQLVLKKNGTTVYSGGILGAPNVTGGQAIILSFSDFLYIASPGTGNNVFVLELYYSNLGDGMSGKGFRPTLQIIGLHR